MGYLDQDKIHQIHALAVDTPGLLASWQQLLSGIPIGYTATLQNIEGNPSFGLLGQLNAMNQVTVLKGGVVPLERWLRNAAYLADQFPDSQKSFRDAADFVAQQRAQQIRDSGGALESAGGLGISSPAELMADVPEKVIYVNDMVPFGFLAGAERVGRSVARLVVPRFEGGLPRNFPFSQQQMKYYGTGWLVGRCHIITNHHVIDARDPGEATASDSDFALQGAATNVQFDYDHDGAAGDIRRVKGVSAANRRLDYAILELECDSGREPLSLWGRPLELAGNSYVPVNVIQHPGGAPKQLGIRNNLAAALRGDDLAYFTDTDGGSSGSPVCSDQWQVVALHKAATMSLGELEYQGKRTAWVNVGTRIDRIVADLTHNHADLWARIGPVVS